MYLHAEPVHRSCLSEAAVISPALSPFCEGLDLDSLPSDLT